MYDPVNELEHYGVLGMKWGVRRTPAQLGHRQEKQKKRLSKKVNKLAWKAEKYDRKFNEKDRSNIKKKYKDAGHIEFSQNSRIYRKAVAYKIKAMKMIDEAYPEFSYDKLGDYSDYGDMAKQDIYDNIMRLKIPKWAK